MPAHEARARDSTSSRALGVGRIFVNSLMSAPAQNVKMFDEAITSARALPSTSSHTSISVATTVWARAGSPAGG